MTFPISLRFGALLGTAALTLSACTSFEGFGSGQSRSSNSQITLVERDVESPEVFQTSEAAVWDGRPTLGGVWIASSKTKQPERVIIRNTANGKFVIGALFNRDTSTSGGAMQLSSDAAAALGINAGVGTVVDVTAVRREPSAGGTTIGNNMVTGGATVPILVGGTRVATSSTTTATRVATKVETATVTRQPTKKRVSAVGNPFVQVGIFSVKANAENTRTLLKRNGVPSKVVQSQVNGKKFWRVVAGPSGSASESRQLVSMIRKLGFTDAFTVQG